MFPADFGYARARSARRGRSTCSPRPQADGEEAKLLAGGQSLLPMMKLRLAAPQTLVDIAGLTELTGVSQRRRHHDRRAHHLPRPRSATRCVAAGSPP